MRTRKSIANIEKALWQPSVNAEILAIWGVFSLETGRWTSSNSALENSILDVLRPHPSCHVMSQLFVYCGLRVRLAEWSSHSLCAIDSPSLLKLLLRPMKGPVQTVFGARKNVAALSSWGKHLGERPHKVVIRVTPGTR